MLDRLLPTPPQLWGGNALSLTPFSPHGLVPANEVQIEISLGEEFWENFCFLPKKAKSLGFTLSLLPALDTEANFGAVAVILESLGKCHIRRCGRPGSLKAPSSYTRPDLVTRKTTHSLTYYIWTHFKPSQERAALLTREGP